MPEQRGREHHRERLAEAIREEIVTILEGELADPRIGLVSVIEVKLAPDGRSAHVFVTALEHDEAQREQSLKGLKSAGAYIRHELAQRLGLRTAPELHFVLDQSAEHSGRIEELLKRARRKRK